MQTSVIQAGPSRDGLTATMAEATMDSPEAGRAESALVFRPSLCNWRRVTNARRAVGSCVVVEVSFLSAEMQFCQLPISCALIEIYRGI